MARDTRHHAGSEKKLFTANLEAVHRELEAAALTSEGKITQTTVTVTSRALIVLGLYPAFRILGNHAQPDCWSLVSPVSLASISN